MRVDSQDQYGVNVAAILKKQRSGRNNMARSEPSSFSPMMRTKCSEHVYTL